MPAGGQQVLVPPVIVVLLVGLLATVSGISYFVGYHNGWLRSFQASLGERKAGLLQQVDGERGTEKYRPTTEGWAWIAGRASQIRTRQLASR